MRDPNRIHPFLNEIGEIWKNNCPDWRFGQLFFNLERVLKTHGTDIFYMEEDELLDYLKNWFDVKPEKSKGTKRLGERGHVYSRQELSRRNKEE